MKKLYSCLVELKIIAETPEQAGEKALTTVAAGLHEGKVLWDDPVEEKELPEEPNLK